MESYSNRSFLQPSPSLNAISWQVENRYNGTYLVPNHFYGKFTITWGGSVVGIHSYGEYGEVGQSKFEQKCKSVVAAIDEFIKCINLDKHRVCNLLLNDDDTPFSGSVYFKVGNTPSGNPVCVFEIASCKQKIRLHAHELGGTDRLISVLNIIKNSIGECVLMQRCWRELDVKKV